MFIKLVIASLLALATAAPQHQQPAKYPAGVNPALCPGFPICDNALLHNPQQQHWGAQPHSHWNHQPAAPQHNHWDHQPAAPQYNHWDHQPHQHHWDDASQWDDGSYKPALHGPATNHLPEVAEKYPAGVNPHTCPNYPFCDVNAGHHHGAAAPLPGFTERLYPAGVSPHQCPNFPYCN